MKCLYCIRSGMTNIPLENNKSKKTKILVLIHIDLNGPHSLTSYKSEKYFINFTRRF